MSSFRLLMMLVLIDAVSWARHVKRKEGFRRLIISPPPLPPSPTSLSSSSSSSSSLRPPRASFHFDDAVNHEKEYQPISNYEENFVKVHKTGSVADINVGAGVISGAGAGAAGTVYLTDNGLRNIAHGSAVQASSAVVNQNAAGKQAAYVAKNTLAQAAAQAASTAVAVLKGKELLLQRLEEQRIDSHKAVESELQQLQQAKRSAKAAQYAAEQAISHVSVLTAALENAQAASELTQKSASEAASELASQIDMVTQAKAKLESVESHLYAARMDYEETKESVEKATYSAKEAQINANDAAVHANAGLSEKVARSEAQGEVDSAIGSHHLEQPNYDYNK